MSNHTHRRKGGYLILRALLVLSIGVFTAVPQAQEPPEAPVPGLGSEEHRRHDFNTLPPLIQSAIRSAVPDMVVQQVDSYLKHDHRVYAARGRLIREMWYVTVRDDGRVLNVVSDFVGD